MRVRVVGMGNIGTRVTLSVLEAGHLATGIDTDPARLERIRTGSADDDTARLCDFVGRTLTLATRPDDEHVFDASLICVPTVTRDFDFDGTRLAASLAALAPCVSPGEVIAVESTVKPHTTSTSVRALLEAGSGLTVGTDVFLVSSPERIDSTLAQSVRTIPKVVGGVTPACTSRGVEVYSQFVDQVVPVADASTAEAAKLLENAYRFVNIAFVNEAAEALSAAGIDVRNVIGAAATKPFGFMPFWPSVGIGGECIPLAGRMFGELVRDAAIPAGIVEAALASERRAADRVMSIVGARHGGPVARVLLLGLTYKSFAASAAGSPGVAIARALAARGLDVHVVEPHWENGAVRSAEIEGAGTVVRLLDAYGGRYDAVVIAAWHDEFRDLLASVDARTIVDLSGSRHYHPDEEADADTLTRVLSGGMA